ncbi:hypothetical protein HanXRQr2_Chr02g0051101 [Helianthus annuus]|uniref:Uncharacterized protein n=1 Tax=Helianthus annuus TaxID=4232 RepID=A0A251VCE2_HELAN|nr:hypothetical protein HanXRQr2_Chr02g0051101 [Helianthus annuus]KAJ0950636.1 hypothetical protein HanPSC8_Chr02g0050521 [Helianthus annuus]
MEAFPILLRIYNLWLLIGGFKGPFKLHVLFYLHHPSKLKHRLILCMERGFLVHMTDPYKSELELPKWYDSWIGLANYPVGFEENDLVLFENVDIKTFKLKHIKGHHGRYVNPMFYCVMTNIETKDLLLHMAFVDNYFKNDPLDYRFKLRFGNKRFWTVYICIHPEPFSAYSDV